MASNPQETAVPETDPPGSRGRTKADRRRERLRKPDDQARRLPTFGLVTRNELAAMLETNPATITKWQGEGLPVAIAGGPGVPAKYRVADVWRWGLERERARAHGSTDPAMNLPVERAKLSRIQTQLAQQKFRKAEGELLEAHEIGRTWSLIVLAIKAKLLALAAAVAERIVSAVRGAADEAQARAAVVEILTSEVRDILRELSGWKEPPAEEPPQAAAL